MKPFIRYQVRLLWHIPSLCMYFIRQTAEYNITGAVAIVFTEDIFAPDLYIDVKLPLDCMVMSF